MGLQWVGVTHMRSLCVDVEAGLASDGHLADSGPRNGHLRGIHDGAAEGRACRGPEVQVRYRSDTGHNGAAEGEPAGGQRRRSDTGQIQVITEQLNGEPAGWPEAQVRYRSNVGQIQVRHTSGIRVRHR